jgi:hypothetical protein
MKRTINFNCGSFRCHISVNTKTGAALYEYGNKDIGFRFTLLSEVGQPFVPAFKQQLETRGWKIDGLVDHGNARPYISDKIITP